LGRFGQDEKATRWASDKLATLPAYRLSWGASRSTPRPWIAPADPGPRPTARGVYPLDTIFHVFHVFHALPTAVRPLLEYRPRFFTGMPPDLSAHLTDLWPAPPVYNQKLLLPV